MKSADEGLTRNATVGLRRTGRRSVLGIGLVLIALSPAGLSASPCPAESSQWIGWPVEGAYDQVHPIGTTYGDSAASQGLHQGLDIYFPIDFGDLASMPRVANPVPDGIVRNRTPPRMRRRRDRDPANRRQDDGNGVFVIGQGSGPLERFWAVAHVRELEGLLPGDPVDLGDPLGEISNYDLSFPHVHLQLTTGDYAHKKGAYGNPICWMNPQPASLGINIGTVTVTDASGGGQYPGDGEGLSTDDVHGDVELTVRARARFGMSGEVEPIGPGRDPDVLVGAGVHGIRHAIHGPRDEGEGPEVKSERYLVEFGRDTWLPYGTNGPTSAPPIYQTFENWHDQYIISHAGNGSAPDPGIDNVVAGESFDSESVSDGLYRLKITAEAAGTPPRSEERLTTLRVNNSTPCLDGAAPIECSVDGHEVTMTLRFSEGMRRNRMNVTYGEAEPFDEETIVSSGDLTGSWTTSSQEYDTWTVSFEPPGQLDHYTMRIDGRDRATGFEYGGDSGTPLTSACMPRKNSWFRSDDIGDTSLGFTAEMCASCRDADPCNECLTGIWVETARCGCELWGTCFDEPIIYDLYGTSPETLNGWMYSECCDAECAETWWPVRESGVYTGPPLDGTGDVWYYIYFDNPSYGCNGCVSVATIYFKVDADCDLMSIRHVKAGGVLEGASANKYHGVGDPCPDPCD